MYLKVKDNYDLRKLKEYGFHSQDNDLHATEECCLLVNDISNEDRRLRFFYCNDLEDIEVEDNIILDCIDYDVCVSDVVFDLIKDGVLEKGE